MPKKVSVFSDEKAGLSPLLEKYGFVIDEKSPDFVISFGGDGTFMKAEHKTPGVPKIILKNSRVCKLCSDLENEEVLKKVSEEKYKVEENIKIIAKANGKELLAVNDITVHNDDPRHAIRYKFSVNEKPLGHEIIGDGIVVSTPLGSTGYYRSITDSFFEVGIGLAFNNSTESQDHMVLKEDSKIELEITRGPAVVFADNQNEKISLGVGDKIIIQKSDTFAKIARVF